MESPVRPQSQELQRTGCLVRTAEFVDLIALNAVQSTPVEVADEGSASDHLGVGVTEVQSSGTDLIAMQTLRACSERDDSKYGRVKRPSDLRLRDFNENY